MFSCNALFILLGDKNFGHNITQPHAGLTWWAKELSIVIIPLLRCH